jgi:hypothetical protein
MMAAHAAELLIRIGSESTRYSNKILYHCS